MTAALLHVLRAGSAVTVQDRGRRGTLAFGLAAGGAADPAALAEAAALLALPPGAARDRLAALEMAGQGGAFRPSVPVRIALTGAPMRASRGGAPLAWGACHALAASELIEIGPALSGVYGYLSVGGGIGTPLLLGSRSMLPAAGLGRALQPGDAIPLGPDPGGPAARRLEIAHRFTGGTVRVIPGPQTDLFDAATRARFAATPFRRDPRGNRQGVRLAHDGAPFAAAGQLALLSEPIIPGDIQMTGDGAPFVLGPDCQTIGGYPRIGTVVPQDLPRVLQAPPGAPLHFAFTDRATALADLRARRTAEAALAARVRPLVRDPADVPDLLGLQLIGGVTAGDDETDDNAPQ